MLVFDSRINLNSNRFCFVDLEFMLFFLVSLHYLQQFLQGRLDETSVMRRWLRSVFIKNHYFPLKQSWLQLHRAGNLRHDVSQIYLFYTSIE